jgi:hypothetical protein
MPRQQRVAVVLFVTIDDGLERAGQVGKRIDGIEFAGLD